MGVCKSGSSSTKGTFEDLYGYSLYTEDGLSSIGPVYNCESDIKVSESDDMYSYYRYGAVEWQHFDDLGEFDDVNNELKTIMGHSKLEFVEKRQEVLDSCLDVLCKLDQEGFFGPKESNRFIVICLSDSSDPIMAKSAEQLNSAEVYHSYEKEFV